MKFSDDFTQIGKMPFEVGVPLVLEDAGLTIMCRRGLEKEPPHFPISTTFTANEWKWTVWDEGLKIGKDLYPYPVMLIKKEEGLIEIRQMSK